MSSDWCAAAASIAGVVAVIVAVAALGQQSAWWKRRASRADQAYGVHVLRGPLKTDAEGLPAGRVRLRCLVTVHNASPSPITSVWYHLVISSSLPATVESMDPELERTMAPDAKVEKELALVVLSENQGVPHAAVSFTDARGYVWNRKSPEQFGPPPEPRPVLNLGPGRTRLTRALPPRLLLRIRRTRKPPVRRRF